jgi:hypothetical protein
MECTDGRESRKSSCRDGLSYFAGPTNDNRLFAFNSNANGIEGQQECAEGSYVYGIDVWYDKNAALANRYLKGYKLRCRGY